MGIIELDNGYYIELIEDTKKTTSYKKDGKVP